MVGPPGQMLCSSEEVLNGHPLLFVVAVVVLTSDSKLFGQWSTVSPKVAHRPPAFLAAICLYTGFSLKTPTCRYNPISWLNVSCHSLSSQSAAEEQHFHITGKMFLV